MNFSRNPITLSRGPSLISKIHAFQMTNELTSDGYYKSINNCVITFAFEKVEELHFKWFNFQNVIWDLEIDIEVREDGARWFDVSFEHTHGIDCVFKCQKITVVDLFAGSPSE